MRNGALTRAHAHRQAQETRPVRMRQGARVRVDERAPAYVCTCVRVHGQRCTCARVCLRMRARAPTRPSGS
eukprot:6212677-Pleurochrysis_carterae.AAC.7